MHTSNAPPPWDGQDTLHVLGLAALGLATLSTGLVPVLLTVLLLVGGLLLSLITWDPKRHEGGH